MSESLISVINIKKAFFKKRKLITEALKGVSLEINKGEILSLLGVNGAGKTTLSSIIASLNPPTFGDVRYRGKSIYGMLVPYRRKIGFCPQKPNLDNSISVEETLYYAGRCFGLSHKEAKDRRDFLLERLSLEQYAKATTFALSGGYKQRFLIARSLVHRPELVILDEPTVGLDPHIRHQLWELIRELKEDGTSVLLTTHYLDEADTLSDRVCLIHQGEVKTVDTPQNLKEKYKKNSLEEVFIEFVDQSEAQLLKTMNNNDTKLEV